MKRPFAVIGFTYIITLIAASYAGIAISAAAGVLSLVFALIVLFGMPFLQFKKAVTAVLLTAAAAFAVFSGFDYFRYQPIKALDNQKAEISGEICEDPEVSYGRYIYTVDANEITVDGKETGKSCKIRIVSYENLYADAFDGFSANVTLELPDEISNTGFNSRSYYKSKGIYLTAVINNQSAVLTKNTVKPPYYYAISLRHYISNVIDKYVWEENGALASGILIGDTSGLSDKVKDDFTNTGISHLLAVSGTQTSLIMQYLLLVFLAMKLPKRLSAIITSAAIIIFMAVTGFSPSVMRAGIMSLVCLAAMIIKRDADVINSLGFSALVLCILNPYAATDVGLLLSLTATLGMVIISPKLIAFCRITAAKLPHFLTRPLKPLVTILCETVGASALTFPVIIFTFGRLSLVSFIANIFEVPLALFVTLLSAILAILSPIPFITFLLRAIALVIRLCSALMISIAGGLAALPFANISASYAFVDIAVVFSAILLILHFTLRKKGSSLVLCLCCGCFVFAVGMFSFAVANHGVMTVADVSGEGAAVIMSEHHAVLIDLPKSKTYPSAVSHYLKINNIKTVDAVILTKYDDDHMENLLRLKNEIPINRVYAPLNGKITHDTGQKLPERITNASSINAPYGVRLTVLPDKENDELISLVSCRNARACVLGENTGGDYSLYNPAAFKSQLLVFSHNPDTEFLKSISPTYASGGKESSADTLSSLVTFGARIDTGKRLYLARSDGGYKICDYLS